MHKSVKLAAVETSDKNLKRKPEKFLSIETPCVCQLSERSKILGRVPRRKALGGQDESCLPKSVVAMANKVSEVLVSA